MRKILLVTLLLSFLISFSQKKLIDAIGNSKIVLLGEQTHGDGAVFDKKVALIKALHEEKGFSLVIFEGGLYDNFKANELYSSKKEDISIYKQSIFPMWSTTKAFNTLLKYVDGNPEMKILGFDSQGLNLFENYYLDDLRALFDSSKIDISEKTYTLIEKTIISRDLEVYSNGKKDSLQLLNTHKLILEKLKAIKNKNLKAKILEQTYKGAFEQLKTTLKVARGEKVYIQNPRDKQMAENLIFLQKQFPNEKIIGWGASYHFTNKINDFEYTTTTEKFIKQNTVEINKVLGHKENELQKVIKQIKELKHAITMGKILKDYYKDDLYSIGFISYEGNYKGSHGKSFPILKPPKNSLEIDLFKKGISSSFLDLKTYPNKEKFYTSVLGYIPLYAKWQTVFDGIYYIPKMYVPEIYDYKSDTIKEVIKIKKESIITGKLIDSETKEPIIYADVFYPKNNKSAISNEKGAFTISKNKNDNSYLKFTAFGYDVDSMQIKNFAENQVIYLKESKGETLNEVVLKTKSLTTKEILKRAQKRIKENYVQTPYNQNFLINIRKYNGKDSLYFNEDALIKTYNKKGINGANKAESSFFSEIQEFRNTTNNYDRDKWNDLGGLWVMLNRDIVLSKANVLYRTSTYELKKDGIINYDNKNVYKISFINNSPGVYSTGYGYPAPESSRGVIYIDTKTFAILKYEHCIKRVASKHKRSKYKTQQNHRIIQTYKEVEGKYFINLFKVIDKNNYYKPETNEFLGTRYNIFQLASEDIETENVIVLKRPIVDIKQKFKPKKEESDFWKERPVVRRNNDFKFENCEQ